MSASQPAPGASAPASAPIDLEAAGKARRGGRSSNNWKDSEIRMMLSQVRGVLPRGADEWEQGHCRSRTLTRAGSALLDREGDTLWLVEWRRFGKGFSAAWWTAASGE